MTCHIAGSVVDPSWLRVLAVVVAVFFFFKVIRSQVTSFSPNVRESNRVLDFGFHAMNTGFQLLDSKSFSVELGFRIPIVSGILDSYSCIPDSTSKNFQDSGIRIPLHGAKFSTDSSLKSRWISLQWCYKLIV